MFKEFLEIPLPDKWWYVLMLVWVVVWKGIALWKSARLGQKWWFAVLFVLNTFGILEILYIYVFSKKRETQHRERRPEDEKDHDIHAHTTGISFLDNAEPVSSNNGEEEKT
ncbi:MAG: DUF5652 family protein [Patescibacteria group bacterium]